MFGAKVRQLCKHAPSDKAYKARKSAAPTIGRRTLARSGGRLAGSGGPKPKPAYPAHKPASRPDNAPKPASCFPASVRLPADSSICLSADATKSPPSAPFCVNIAPLQGLFKKSFRFRPCNCEYCVTTEGKTRICSNICIRNQNMKILPNFRIVKRKTGEPLPGELISRLSDHRVPSTEPTS